MEDCGSIPKLNADLSTDIKMAINCEYGAFDNDHRVLPLTTYDKQVDEESPRPGEQAFEKLCAGHYLGETFRLALLDLHDRGVVFKGQDVAKLKEPYKLDTGDLSAIENDNSLNQGDTEKMFKQELGVETSLDELVLVKRLANAIALRAARLCSCGIAAICKKKGITSGHVAADGSVAIKHPTVSPLPSARHWSFQLLNYS
jgi:hexokinase